MYRVVADVPSESLTTVMQVIEGAARIIKVEPVESAARSASSKRGYVGGKRNKGISGDDLLLKCLRGSKSPISADQLRSAFEKHGFSPNSLSPTLSKAVAKKLVVIQGNGAVAMAKK
jgi:hypothetical protein